ncbi:PREDICTED: uncharacterized protein LOC109593383, partial [Amphimedon queenslandica]|uniref:Uncharacterized protein n=2 Tax=Amphimedon queenslandica TaxID=400682 RepID=A0AAN0K4D6_AMPQE
SSYDEVPDDFPVLSSSLIDGWSPLLSSIGSHCTSAKTSILESLITVLNDGEVADIQLLLLGWIGLLLEDDTINSNTDNVTSSSGFIEIDLSVDSSLMAGPVHYDQLLMTSINNPGPYTYLINER